MIISDLLSIHTYKHIQWSHLNFMNIKLNRCKKYGGHYEHRITYKINSYGSAVYKIKNIVQL